ncbi:MAG: hypothetical protein JWL84_1025 [Rhodospirillales bacterium]|jgi:hypothetical protein|nr:hypothetical protein [Rhodospirillales bacterium]
MAEDKGGPKATFIVVSYVAGARGALKVGEQIQSPSEQNARIRAEKLMATEKVLGVDVVKQVADPEAGDYAEPEYLVRLGRFPEFG